MPALASLIAAVIPMTAYLIIIWRMDRYEREPFGQVFIHFLWGAVGAIIFALIGSGIMSGFFSIFIEQPDSLNLTSTVVIAPFVEEITKGILLFATVNTKKFDNVTDGLVYGGAIGLGFGMTENALYFFAYGTNLASWIFLVLIRTIFSAVMHGVSTGTLGAFLASAKFSNSKIKTRLLPYLGLLTAMLLHFLWNFSVSFSNTYIFGILFMLIMIILFFYLFKKSLRKEEKIIREELTEEAEHRIIPVEHIEYLSSNRRNDKTWIDKSIRKEYIQAAVKLAFRKAQFKATFGKRKSFYEKEIDIYREKVIDLLNRKPAVEAI